MLAEAALAVGLAELFLRLARFRIPALGGPDSDARQASPDAARTAEEVSWAIAATAARFPWPVRCLARAVAGRWMLSRRGLRSALIVGVRRTATGGVSAHAWLAAGHSVVIGARDAPHFRPLHGPR